MQVKDDLLLWVKILHHSSHRGIDINNITFTEPKKICVSDACERSIGGYNTSGMAWRYKLPKEMIGRLAINVLEFLASAITIHLLTSRGAGPHKILAFTDSSSALG